MDPRGPDRTIVAVEPTASETRVTLDCGHIGHANQIYSYRIGDTYRCFACRKLSSDCKAGPR